MSTEFGLYHQSSKTFIWLGKVCSGSERYQTPDRAIVAFMADQQAGEFQIASDLGNLPDDEEDGWREIGNWPWPDNDDKEHDISDRLVAFYPRLDGFPDNIGANDVHIYSHALTLTEVQALHAE